MFNREKNQYHFHHLQPRCTISLHSHDFLFEKKIHYSNLKLTQTGNKLEKALDIRETVLKC